MKTSTRRFVLSLLLAAAAGCASKAPPQPPQRAQLERAVAPPRRSDPPAYLPGTARAILKTLMAPHEQEMRDLVTAIMLLDYDQIRDRAQAMSSDTRLARPLTEDATELASALPESFFVFQDELRARAGALATAAEAQHALHVADAYGRLSETCVKCHDAYRRGR